MTNSLINIIQISGQAVITEGSNCFMFVPDNAVDGQADKYRKMGYAQQMSNGEFHFVAAQSHKSNSRLIKKLPHGRASETKDGAIQLTLKVYKNENVNAGIIIWNEALDAVKAIQLDQLKR